MALETKDILKEVEAGLPNSARERDEARENLDFAELRFEKYPIKNRDGRFQSDMPPRLSPVMKRVVEILSGFLYKTQPVRRLPDPDAGEILNAIYKRSRAWAKWKRADELTAIQGFTGYQFAGHTDPRAPVKLTQWQRNEVEVWTDPDDPTRPMAVATIDAYDNGQRLRLYTEERIYTYEKSKGTLGPAFGGAAWKKTAEKPNPYRALPDEEDPDGAPLIPFTFQHWFYPTTEFTRGGPGHNLRILNEGVNTQLTMIGDSMPYISMPIGIASGVDAAWRPPAKVRPGDWLPLAASDVDAAGSGPVPTLSYLVPELGYIDGNWSDLNNWLDHSLEMWGVPPSLIRMVQSGARSGLSIQSEQLPVVNWVEGRRGAWADYEDDAARMAMTVAWNRYAAAGMTTEANLCREVLEDWSLTIRWGSLYTMLPGQERNMEDDWRLERGLVSKIGILMERSDMTEAEALETLQRVEQQNQMVASLGIEPGLPQPPPMDMGMGAPLPGEPDAQQGQGGGIGINDGGNPDIVNAAAGQAS
jgi:hypothetical protein